MTTQVSNLNWKQIATLFAIAALIGSIAYGVNVGLYSPQQGQDLFKVTFEDIAKSAGMSTEQLNTTLNSMSYEVNPLYLSTSSAYNYTIHPLSDRGSSTVYYVMAADNGTLAYTNTNKTHVEELALGNMTTAGRVLCVNFGHNYSVPIQQGVSVDDSVNGTVRVYCNVTDSTGSPYTISVDSRDSTFYLAQDSADRFINDWSSNNATYTVNNAIHAGNTICITGGLYMQNGSFKIADSNRTLILDNNAILSVGDNQNAAAIEIDGSVVIGGLKHIKISGGEIYGNNYTQSLASVYQSAGYGVFAVYCDDLAVDGMYIHDVMYHSIFFGACSNSRAINNICINAYLGHGIESDDWNPVGWHDGYGRNILFENNYCENQGWSQMKMENINGGRCIGNTLVGGIYNRGNAFGMELSNPNPDVYSYDTIVSMNIFRNCTNAMQIYDWGDNIQVLDNIIESCGGGIEAGNSTGLTISGNSFNNITIRNGISVDTCNNTRISNNKISNQTNTSGAGLLIKNSNNTEVNGGTSKNCGKGLFISNSYNGTLQGYTAIKSVYTGCQLYGDNWATVGNRFSDNGRVGLDLRGQNNTVIGSVITSNGWQGIYILNYTATHVSVYNLISSNRIDNSLGGPGIFEASGDYNMICDNIVTRSTGLYNITTSGANTIKDNNIGTTN